MTYALLEALISCGREGSERTRECVQLLIDYGAVPRELDLEPLFNQLLCRYPMPFKELSARYESRQSQSFGFLGNAGDFAGVAGLTSVSSAAGAQIADGFGRVVNTVSLMVSGGPAPETSSRTSNDINDAGSCQSLRASKAGTVMSNSRRLRDRIRRRAAQARSGEKQKGSNPADDEQQADLNKAGAPGLSRAGSAPGRSLQSYPYFVLENLLDQSGYKGHLSARTRFNNQGATWMDLMMWSVFAGHFDLSRILWLNTPSPLRAAVMARRLVMKMAESMMSPTTEKELHEAADMYEDWALGILDQVELTEEAIDMLTCTAARRDPLFDKSAKFGFGRSADKSGWISTWNESVIDEASSVPHPCRKFLAHRHCQELLAQYLAGHYRGSAAAIDTDTSFMAIVLDIMIHILNLPLCGFLPSCVTVTRPTFPQLLDEDLDDDDDDDDDDEVDGARKTPHR